MSPAIGVNLVLNVIPQPMSLLLSECDISNKLKHINCSVLPSLSLGDLGQYHITCQLLTTTHLALLGHDVFTV